MNKKGFTLIELLIVIGIIAILASAVIVAINPGQQFAAARDAARSSDINTLYNSLISYQVSNHGWGELSTEITTEFTEICNTNLDNPDCNGLADLSAITPDHINQIPVDPQGSVSETADGTGYFIAEGSAQLVAENAETGFIGVGITEAEYGESGSGEEDGEENGEEEAYFEVEIAETNSPVNEGEDLNVDATIENTGELEGDQVITLETNDTQRDSTSVNLNPGDQTTETLTWNTEDGDAGDYTAGVSSDDDSDDIGVEVKAILLPDGAEIIDGDIVHNDADGNMWSPTLDLPAYENDDEEYEWGCRGQEVGADSDTDGQTNTNDIVNYHDDTGNFDGEDYYTYDGDYEDIGCDERNDGTVAAKECDDLDYAGHDDWYLPAIDTLEGLYDEAGSTPSYDDNAQSGLYRSSTEDSDDHARNVLFGGIMSVNGKDSSYQVRCVRR